VNSDISLKFGVQISAVIKRESDDSVATILNIDIWQWLSYFNNIWHADATDAGTYTVGSGLRRHFPLLPSLRDGLVTCLRACAALACLARGF